MVWPDVSEEREQAEGREKEAGGIREEEKWQGRVVSKMETCPILCSVEAQPMSLRVAPRRKEQK